jgi:hypothetical protein
MRPIEPDPKPPDDFLRAASARSSTGAMPWCGLPTARLARVRRFEARFGELYHPRVGRPGVPIRVMVALSYLQRTFRSVGRRGGRTLGREPVLAVLLRLRSPAARATDRPELAGPPATGGTSREDKVLLLQETIAAAQRSAAVKPQSL